MSEAKASGAWKKTGNDRGIYSRRLVSGQLMWGFYSTARRNVVQAGRSRQVALDAQSKDRLQTSALPQPALDTRTRISTLAEEVRESKRARLKPSSFRVFEVALDSHILPELGHLRPAQATADRLAQFVRDLEKRGLRASSIRRYMAPLDAIFKLAIRRGCITTSPLELLTPDERPREVEPRKRYEWSPEALTRLLAAAQELDKRPAAQQTYYPLIATLVLTGCRVGEALALRWGDVDLLSGIIHIRHSWSRLEGLCTPKTRAGLRVVPAPDLLVDILVEQKPVDAENGDFVFPAKHGAGPISYWNFRDRGWVGTLERARLGGEGLTIHDLRHAAASLLIASGVSDVDVASVLGHASANVTRAIYAHVYARETAHDKVRNAFQSAVGSRPST